MKRLKKTLLFLLLFLSCFTFISCDKSTDDSVEPIKAKIAKAGKVYSNYTMEHSNSHKKLMSEQVAQVQPGQNIWIMESGRWDDFKIQMPNGSMGWIKGEYIEPSKNTFIQHFV